MPKLSDIQRVSFSPYQWGGGRVVLETGTAREVCYLTDNGKRRHGFFDRRTERLQSLGPCWCEPDGKRHDNRPS